jgi:hypothetical protein
MKHGFTISFVALVLITACSSTPTTDDGGTDSSVKDAKPDKSVVDTGTDAAMCGSGLTCEICDGTFSTMQMTAPFAKAGVCSSADITAFVTACGATSTQTSCDTWQTAESTSAASCLGCVFSDQNGSKWGVYVCDANGACAINTPGCLDVALASVSQEKQAGGSGSCGDLYNDAYTCEGYACNSCVSQSDFSSCLTSADASECKSYTDLAFATTGKCAAANDPDASTTINACFDQTDADLQMLTTLLCGGADGG